MRKTLCESQDKSLDESKPLAPLGHVFLRDFGDIEEKRNNGELATSKMVNLQLFCAKEASDEMSMEQMCLVYHNFCEGWHLLRTEVVVNA